MTDRYAVVGNPVSHSKSPAIHAAFARQTGQDLSDDAVYAALDEFEAVVRRFAASGGRGMNVTLPFKHRAFALAADLTPRAKAANAVNTLSLEGQRIAGDNTDGVGLIRDITRNLGFVIGGKRILLMGAGGGAAYGVCGPLLDECPASLTIANRSPEKAFQLRDRFTSSAKDAIVAAIGYDEIDALRFDLVVNATSAGLNDKMPPVPSAAFAPGALAYDMVYGHTRFLGFAQQLGVRAADGLGMLVEQAAESFYVWRGVKPETAPVIAMLRSAA